MSSTKNKLYNKKYFQDRAQGQKCMAYSILKFLQKHHLKTILDVGSGTGWLTSYLNNKGLKAIGCDPSSQAVKISGHTKATAQKLPFPNNKFDAVLGISIVEHMTKKDVTKFLKEAHRVLKKSGWIFLITPNLATPFRFLLGKKWSGYADPTHINLYTPWRLKKKLSQHSFTNLKLTYSYYPDIPFDWGFPPPYKKLPQPILNLTNYLILSTPLFILRHSFWLSGQKYQCQ